MRGIRHERDLGRVGADETRDERPRARHGREQLGVADAPRLGAAPRPRLDGGDGPRWERAGGRVVEVDRVAARGERELRGAQRVDVVLQRAGA